MATMNRRGLTQKQEQFCLLIVQGEPQYEAYKKAGYTVKNTRVADVRASVQMRNSKIVARVAELRAYAAKRATLTLEGMTADLITMRDGAIAEKQYGAAVQAQGLIAKMNGFLVDKKELSILHKPARSPTTEIELSEEEWSRRFASSPLLIEHSDDDE